MSREETVSKLKENLTKFKEDFGKQGWEDDEVDEKVAEVFENFPWYKFNGGEKRTWKSTLWNICLFSFIIYLAAGAYLNKNKRLKKNIKDFIFDMQIPYQQGRISRLVSLPFIKYLKLGHMYNADCLMNNPFYEKEMVINCNFCENITSVEIMKTNDEDVGEMIINGELFKLHDVPGYYNSTIGFNDVKELFMKYGEEMDEAICEIYKSDQYTKVSDYFKLTEEEVNEKNHSIGWKNCEAYGTRFYRKLYTRPPFIEKSSEIVLEKSMYLLQPGQDVTLNDVADGSSYIFQVQGETTYSFSPPTDCLGDCINGTIAADLKAGQIIVFPNTGWKVSMKSHGERLSMIYISAFIPPTS